MLDIFILLLPLFGLMGVGYIIGISKKANEQWVKVLNLFGYYIAFPALIFNSLSIASISLAVDGKVMLLQAFIGITLMGVTYAICSAMKLSRELKNTFVIGIYFANAAYVGIPALDAVFGTTAAGEGAIFAAVMIFITFTMGVGILEASRHEKIHTKKIFVSILKNPLIWSAVLGILVSIFNIQMPSVAEKLLDYLAGAATPAVLVALGIFISYTRPEMDTIKAAGLLSVIKMLAIPLVFTLIMFITPNHDWLDVTYIQMSMPLAVTTFAFAEIYPMDKHVISNSILFSTIGAIITVPLVMWLTTVI
ncbi:MAG: AEC family transporter [bacterium]|nr:AEC family transporter [bacterium]